MYMATSTCILPSPDCEELSLVVERNHSTQQFLNHCLDCGYYDDGSTLTIRPKLIRAMNEHRVLVITSIPNE